MLMNFAAQTSIYFYAEYILQKLGGINILNQNVLMIVSIGYEFT